MKSMMLVVMLISVIYSLPAVVELSVNRLFS